MSYCSSSAPEMSYRSYLSYTCFLRLELQAVAHPHTFSKLELYTINELAIELSVAFLYFACRPAIRVHT